MSKYVVVGLNPYCAVNCSKALEMPLRLQNSATAAGEPSSSTCPVGHMCSESVGPLNGGGALTVTAAAAPGPRPGDEPLAEGAGRRPRVEEHLDTEWLLPVGKVGEGPALAPLLRGPRQPRRQYGGR